MPPKIELERLGQEMQLSASDPLCEFVPDISDMTTKAWEFILLTLDDGYATCKGCADAQCRIIQLHRLRAMLASIRLCV